MCQHPGFPRGGVTLTLFPKTDVPLKTVLFLFAYSSSEAATLLTAKTRRRSSVPAALTLANVISNDDRVQSANSVSHYLIISGDLLA